MYIHLKEAWDESKSSYCWDSEVCVGNIQTLYYPDCFNYWRVVTPYFLRRNRSWWHLVHLRTQFILGSMEELLAIGLLWALESMSDNDFRVCFWEQRPWSVHFRTLEKKKPISMKLSYPGSVQDFFTLSYPHNNT